MMLPLLRQRSVARTLCKQYLLTVRLSNSPVRQQVIQTYLPGLTLLATTVRRGVQQHSIVVIWTRRISNRLLLTAETRLTTVRSIASVSPAGGYAGLTPISHCRFVTVSGVTVTRAPVVLTRWGSLIQALNLPFRRRGTSIMTTSSVTDRRFRR